MSELNPKILGLMDNINITNQDLQNLGNLLLHKTSHNYWLDYISNPIAIAKVENREIVYVNNNFVKIFQRQQQQISEIDRLTDYIDLFLWNKILTEIKNDDYVIVKKIKVYDIHKNAQLFDLIVKSFTKDNQLLIIVIFQEVKAAKLVEFASQISKLSTLLSNLPTVAYHCHNDRERTLEFISEECLNLTGYYPSELIDNKNFSFNNLIHPLDADLVCQTIQKALKSYRDYTIEYRLINRSKQEKWVFEKGRGIYDPLGEVLFLQGFIMDITEKKKIEQQKNLLLTLTQEIAHASDFKTALLITLKKVCQFTNWDFGEAWLPDSTNTFLQYSVAWFSPQKNTHPSYPSSLQEFKEKSYQHKFTKSTGLLPTKVWELKQSYWLENSSVEPLFLRKKLARKCGLKAAFGVPIVCDQQVVAVLVFFLRQSRPEDRSMIALMESLACQLSSLFQQKKMQVALKESQRQLASLIDSTSGMFFRLSYSPNWLTNYLSNSCENLTGYTQEELIDNDSLILTKIIHPLDLERVINFIEKSIKNKTSYVVEYRIFTKNNQQKWVWEKGHGVFNDQGELLGIEGFVTDISDRKQIEQTLEETETKYQNIFENTMTGMFQITPDGHYISANLALARIYGYNSPEELKQDLTETSEQFYLQPEVGKEFINLLQANGFVSDFECQVIRKDGKKIWISKNVRIVYDREGKILYYQGTVEDITKYKEVQEKLRQQAFYDPLTNLPNRAFFLQKLEGVVEHLKNNSDSSEKFALFFLDCDRFKIVNDSLGHLIGDELLAAVAQRLLKCVREKDIVARIGGDEFTILLNNIADLKQVVIVAERIKQEFSLPIYLEKHTIFSGVTMGILYSDSLDKNNPELLKPEILLKNADTALYKAKLENKGCYQFFQSEMQNEALAELELENHLREAIEKKELEIYYQPIVCTTTRKIKAFEALLRWKHPHRGFIAPGEFIPMAEKTDLIIPLGNWILEEVCIQIKKWREILQQEKPHEMENIMVSINISYRQFCHDQFIENIDSILEKIQIPPESLKLELTESYCMIDEKVAIEKMKQLQARNINLWIDDFGTGYSSLSYLHKLPINGLKIDLSFVSEIDKDIIKESIAKAIINLTTNLDLKVISEGIETEEQLQKLQIVGNKLGQGFLFSQPLDREKATSFLLENI